MEGQGEIGGILQGTASLINAGVGLSDYAFGTTSARSYSQQRRLQKHQFDFEREMFEKQVQLANTAHQREVQDLKDAGLNPILSAGAQPGSATPSAGGGSGGGQVDVGPTGVDVANMMANTAKTISEMKNIDADTKNKEQQYILTPDLIKSTINLNNANSAEAREHAKKLVEETIKTKLEQKTMELQQKMLEMDVYKRKAYYQDEMKLYITNMKKELASAGLESNELYQAIDHAFATVGKVFTGGVSYNYGHNTSHSTSHGTSNVNIHNADYNPTRHATIGF